MYHAPCVRTIVALFTCYGESEDVTADWCGRDLTFVGTCTKIVFFSFFPHDNGAQTKRCWRSRKNCHAVPTRCTSLRTVVHTTFSLFQGKCNAYRLSVIRKSNRPFVLVIVLPSRAQALRHAYTHFFLKFLQQIVQEEVEAGEKERMAHFLNTNAAQ